MPDHFDQFDRDNARYRASSQRRPQERPERVTVQRGDMHSRPARGAAHPTRPTQPTRPAQPARPARPTNPGAPAREARSAARGAASGNPRASAEGRRGRTQQPAAQTQRLQSGRPQANRTVQNARGERPGATGAGGGAQRAGREWQQPKRGKSPLAKIGCAVAAAAVVLLVAPTAYYALTTPASFNITLNGETKTIERFDSVDSLIKDGLADPQPGDYLAVDGSVIEAGGGEKSRITVNDKDPRATFWPLRQGDAVVVENGADVTEDYTFEEISTDPESTEAGWGAIHAYVDGKPRVTELRTGKDSGRTSEVEVQAAVDSAYVKYNAQTGGDKVVALTFDDGPWPETTEQVLDVLDQYGAKATFFTIGDQVAGHSDLVKRAFDAGHQICTHSWDHAAGSGNGVDLTRMSAEEQIAEVTKGYEAIEAVTGTTASHVFRAPGGNFTGSIVWTLRDYVDAEIGWNVDTEDWRRPGADTIANRIMSAKSGEIVLMHDGGGDRTQTVEALRTALPYLRDQGFRFVTVDELLAYNSPTDMLASA